MKLTEEQFNRLIANYLKKNTNLKISEVDVLAFEQVFSIIDEVLGEKVNLVAISTNDPEYSNERKQLYHVLDLCIQVNPFKFDEQAARKAVQQLDKQLNYADLKRLHGDVSNLGIRDKYLKNQLGNDEWLTDVDLKHALETMGLVGSVHITRFNPDDIGSILHFARIKNKDTRQPYSIPFLFNKGSDGNNLGTHWFAGIISVDPVTNTITYQVEDSFKLSAVEQHAIKKVMERSIHFQDSSQKAFPNAVIDESSCKIIGRQSQTDGYSCGYRALYNILKNPLLAGIVNGNIKAKSYADCSNTSNALIKHFYKLLLDNLTAPTQQISQTQRARDFLPAIGQPDKKQLYTHKVDEFLDHIESEPKEAPLEAMTQIKPVLMKSLNDYKSTDTHLSFPLLEDKTLTAPDYHFFLASLHLKLQENKTSLEQLVITPCDVAALSGLSTFLNKNILLATELTLEVGALSGEQPQQFVAKLNSLLLKLSEQNVTKVTVIDKSQSITPELWDKVAHVIKHRPITVELLLPSHLQSTALQRDIDQEVSTNRFYRIPTELKGTGKLNTPKMAKRSRSKHDVIYNLNVDIELQQEQQVEVQVSVQRTVAQQQGDSVFGKLDIVRHAADFEFRFFSDDFALGSNFLLADVMVKKVWNNWLGHLIVDHYSSSNSYISGLSKNACEQLLKHQKQFLNGIDCSSLPKGFVFIEYPVGSNQKILHYDADQALFTKTNGLPVVLVDNDSIKGFAFPVFQEVLDTLAKGSPVQKRIVDYWHEQQRRPYDQQQVKLLQHYLPNLLKLNESQLNQLLTLCSSDKQLDKRKFSLFMDQVHTIAEAAQLKDDENAIYNTKVMKVFGFDNLKLVNELAVKISKAPASDLLLQLLANKPRLLEQYQQWNEKLGPLDPDAVFRVYAQKGEVGLQQLFAFWLEHEDHLDALQIIVKNVSSAAASLEPLLDPRYQEAIGVVRGFSGAKLQWWNALLQQHTDSGANDELPALIASFKAFSAAIEAKGLQFYTLPQGDPKPFADVKSLPTALSRMLSLLNYCEKGDIAYQWQGITQLSLHSTGAIRAFTDAQMDRETCGFVLPEMKYNAVYEPVKKWRDVGNSKTEEELVSRFYTCLAYQKYRLPLDFYKQTFAHLLTQKYSLEVKAQLAGLLVAATTGMESTFFLKGKEKSLEQWSNIIDQLNNIPLPSLLALFKGMAQETFVNSLFRLGQPPYLPILEQLFKLITNSVSVSTWVPTQAKKELEKKFRDLADTCRKLEILTKLSGYSVYNGMKFYNDKDYIITNEIEYPIPRDFNGVLFDKDYWKKSGASAPNSVFFEHISIAEDIQYGGVKNSETTTALLDLISTFQIDRSNVHQARDIIDRLYRDEKQHLEPIKNPEDVVTSQNKKTSFIVDLLKQITTNVDANGRKLTVADLTQLITNLYQQHPELNKEPNAKALIIAYFKANMAAYYPDGFFDNLLTTPLSEDIKNKISEVFANEKDLVTHFLERFNDTATDHSYKELLQKLIWITEPMSDMERKSFLSQFERKAFYGAGTEKTSILAFNKLFAAILNSANGANDFMYLLAQKDSENCQGLIDKATLYLTTILPNLDQNRSVNTSKNDVLALVAQLLLASPATSVSRPINAIFRSDHYILDKITALMVATQEQIAVGTAVDWQELENQLSTLQGSIRLKIKALDELIDKLKSLNKPKEVVVSLVDSKPVAAVAANSSFVSNSINTVASFLGRILLGVPAPVKVEMPTTPVAVKTEAKSELISLDAGLFNAVLKEISRENQRRQDYAVVFSDLFKVIYQMASQYPAAKGLIVEFMGIYIKNHKGTEGLLIVDVWNCVHTLQKEFTNLDDVDIVRSLCENYSGKVKLSPAELLSILNHANYKDLDNSSRKLVLKIIAVSRNNVMDFTNEQLLNLITLCKSPNFVKVLPDFYNTAPYPSIGQIINWDTKAKSMPDYLRSLENFYNEFDKNPASREVNNGFNLKQAKLKRNEIQGLSIKDSELRLMANETRRVRDLSTADLLIEFKQYKEALPPIDKVRLVALAAELLYRSKAKEHNSFEINTTQYLASLAALKAGSHNTRQIETGEGKSRIAAIDVACQFALGKTVDFITSDVQLATRDYLEFQSYFKLLGASTNIIAANTPPNEYRIGGINYSDAANLSLFRNKARSTGQAALVIAPQANDRSLVLDECDKVYFDTIERYNFSAEGDNNIKNMEWVYPILMDFFAQDDDDPHAKPESKNSYYYYNDIDQCTKRFLDFALSKLDDNQKLKLKALPQSQLEMWQESAMTARALVLGKHYVIEPDNTIITATGPKVASEAKLRMGDRLSRYSKFSFGVQQCLHARLNQLMKHPNKAKNPDEKGISTEEKARRDEEYKIVTQLKECSQPFNIDPEKQIQYSSGSKTLLDDYKEGSLLAVTGTAGSMIERQEATGLYGNMEFIAMPRHKGLARVDKPLLLTAHFDEQVKALVSDILDGRRKHQPILIFCEDDNASLAMTKTLEIALQGKEPAGPRIQNIHSKMSLTQEKDAVDKAGLAGMITVTTGMAGRGTDIKLGVGNNEQEFGLKILGTFLPRQRDLEQMFGRSGRYGAPGDARLILNKQELKKRLGKSSLTDGFYTATEAYIKQQQAIMDRRFQSERLIKNTVNDFSKALTDNFFNDLVPKTEINLSTSWMKFNKDKDQLWNVTWQQIASEMDQLNPDPALINSHLTKFKQETQALWSELHRQIEAKFKQNKTEPLALESLNKEVGALKLTHTTTQLIKSFNLNNSMLLKTMVYDKYDPAHDGRAVVYTRPFEKLRATLRGERPVFADFRAWRQGHGILFPNLRAFLSGHMSFSQFLLGYGKQNSYAVLPQSVLKKERPKKAETAGEESVAVKVGRTFSSYAIMDKEFAGHKVTNLEPSKAEIIPLNTKVDISMEPNPTLAENRSKEPESTAKGIKPSV